MSSHSERPNMEEVNEQNQLVNHNNAIIQQNLQNQQQREAKEDEQFFPPGCRPNMGEVNEQNHLVNDPADHNNAIIQQNLQTQQQREAEEDEQLFPPGYRFVPHDGELIFHYLQKKALGLPLPRNRIRDVELYKHNPYDLAGQYRALEDNWYFFTPRDRKYRHGERPNRAAGDGFWKSTGADKNVMHNGKHVGNKTALGFYLRKPPKGEKTNWMMHEYKLLDAPKKKRDENDMRLDDWVLCKIYKKDSDKGESKKSEQQDDQPEHSPTETEERNAPPALEDDDTTPTNRNNHNSFGYSNQHMYNAGDDHNNFGYSNQHMSNAPDNHSSFGSSNQHMYHEGNNYIESSFLPQIAQFPNPDYYSYPKLQPVFQQHPYNLASLPPDLQEEYLRVPKGPHFHAEQPPPSN